MQNGGKKYEGEREKVKMKEKMESGRDRMERMKKRYKTVDKKNG